MSSPSPAVELAGPRPDVRHQVVIIGGGNAGISVAARLHRAAKHLDIAVVEPAKKHYYQPLWTLVGGGVFDKKVTERSESSVIPPGVTWIREAVADVCPEENGILTASGKRIGYQFLVVAPGIQIDWDGIPGLAEALGHDGVCSNYSYEYVDKTWEFINAFRGGTAIFTHPNTPVKCGGAPQKIAYLADEAFRKNGVREKTNLIFASANGGIFAVPKYAATLNKVIARKGIDARYRQNLIEVRGEEKQAVFENLDTGEQTTLPYDLLHVTPPMSAPDFLKRGPLGNEGGWVDVDKFTLQHVHYSNVFSLGDASSLPTSKTGAAIRKQAPVVVSNLLAAIADRTLTARYDGYTACPLVTGYGKLVLAEFDYDNNPKETFPFDQSKERRSMYLLKAYGLPRLYWHGIMKGRV